MGTPAYPSPALPCSPASPGGPSLFPALPRPSPHIPGQPLVLGLEQSLREACCRHCCFWIACTAPFWASALHLYPREGLYFVEKSLLSHPSIAARASLWSCSVVATCNTRLAAGRAGPSQLASFPSRAFPPPSHCSRSCGSGELGELSAYPCLGPLQPRLCSFALEDRQRGRCCRLESSDPPHTHTPSAQGCNFCLCEGSASLSVWGSGCCHQPWGCCAAACSVEEAPGSTAPCLEQSGSSWDLEVKNDPRLLSSCCRHVLKPSKGPGLCLQHPFSLGAALGAAQALCPIPCCSPALCKGEGCSLGGGCAFFPGWAVQGMAVEWDWDAPCCLHPACSLTALHRPSLSQPVSRALLGPAVPLHLSALGGNVADQTILWKQLPRGAPGQRLP